LDPKWARRTKSLDALLPILYLRGVSTGDFQGAVVTSSITNEAADELKLAKGQSAYAVIMRSSRHRT
jgi:hypothetical protein